MEDKDETEKDGEKMKIVQYGSFSVQMGFLEKEYDELVQKGAVKPVFIKDLYIDPGNDLMLARDDSCLAGILMYARFNPFYFVTLGDLGRMIEESTYGAVSNGNQQVELELFDLPGFRDYTFEGDLAFLYAMESFRKGAGRAMVAELKQSPGIEGIFLQPYLNTQGFFERMGFQETGIFIGEEPLMVWMRS